MPERGVHDSAALATARLAAHLDRTQAVGPEWVPTLVFYAVIHLTEALLAERAIHPEGHAARTRAIALEWGDAAADLFEALRDLSEQWRYSGRPPIPDDVRAAKDWTDQLLSMTGQAWPVEGFLAVD